MPTQYEISINPTSAKGDILSHDGSSRIRIAAGTNGQILTASSSAGLLWKTFSTSADSDVALIADVTTTSSLSIYTISSIPQTYQDLKLLVISDSSADTGSIRVSLESTQGTNHHEVQVRQANNGTVSATYATGVSYFNLDSGMQNLVKAFNDVDIFDYASTDKFKTVLHRTGNYLEGYGTNHYGSGYYANTTAVSTIVLRGNGPTMDSGARFILYGIKRSS